MSKIKRKIQACRERGCYVGRAWWVDDKPWYIYIEGEWTTRGYFTKRQAVNLAYAISVSKKLELEVTFDTPSIKD